MRYDDVDSYYDERYDYDNIVRDSDELYSYDDDSWDYDDNDASEQVEWENYYHTITDELVDD
jgi:hypothetical protein